MQIDFTESWRLRITDNHASKTLQDRPFLSCFLLTPPLKSGELLITSVQIPTADNGYASPDALLYTPITPPQSSKDISQQLSVSAVTKPREDVDSNVHGHRRAHRARTRAADAIEGPREVVHTSKAKTVSKAPRHRDGKSDRRLRSDR
jgi:hypothetical protein